MQGRENGSGDLMELKAQRALYGPESGYRSETGGLMEALRKLTAQQSARARSWPRLARDADLVQSATTTPGAIYRTI